MEGDFAVASHRLIYSAILDLFEGGQPLTG